MKGLLLKDWYQLLRNFRMTGIIAGLFLVVSLIGEDTLYFLLLLTIIVSKLPISLLSYDERDHWEGYTAALPCTRRQLVSAKYLMGVLINGGIFVVALVLHGGKMLLTGHWDGWTLLGLAFAMVMVNLLTTALIMPFCFKLGTEKGRMALFVISILVCGGAAALLFTTDAMGVNLLEGYILPLALGAASSVVIYIVSWLISARVYQQREL